ncbi:Divergent AAA domain [Mycobacteroides abscessus subsp. bolletii]|nr:Divergent AAA domain [Mycobacteroides abscessus subsp. bolletii]
MSYPSENLEDRYIAQQLNLDEDRQLEFKEARNNFSTESLEKYCCALANVGGGKIFFGITDKKPREVVGTEVFKDFIEREHRLREMLKVPITAKEHRYQGKRVVEFIVSSRPRGSAVDRKGTFWTRSGESLTPMNFADLVEIGAESKISFESCLAIEHCTAEDVFSLLDVSAIYNRLGRSDPQIAEDRLRELEQLRFIQKIDNQNEFWAITNLGAITAAKDLKDFNLGNFQIRVIKYQDTGKVHAVSDEIFSEGYAISLPNTLSHLKRMLPIREEIEGDRVTVELYPEVALRELVANALIHQDFEEPSGGNYPTVEVFEDRVEITNGGQPLIDVKKFLRENSQRNRELSDAMRLLKFAENRGSGVDRSLLALEEIHGAAPEFIKESHATKVILHGTKKWEQMSSEERAWSAYMHCALLYEHGEGMTNSSLRERFGLPSSKSSQVSQLITVLLEEGQIVRDPAAPGGRRGSRYIPTFEAS